MKILVLGGAGYIGSHTVYELIDAGEEVVIIDNLETGHIEAVHPQAKFYKGDLRDKDFVDSVLDQEKDIDAVIHFAANSLVGESMVDPLKYYDNNLCGTKTMENQKRYRSWRQTAQNQQIPMERQSFPWKKCLNGHLRRITYDMFHFGILTLVEHTRMEKSERHIIQKHI